MPTARRHIAVRLVASNPPRRLTRGLCALLVLGACGQSSFAHRGELTVTEVTPATVSARGGDTVLVRGSGFGFQPEAWVNGLPVEAELQSPDVLALTTPRTVAGPAELRISTGLADKKWPEALVIEPLALTFAEAPEELTPPLPGEIHALEVLSSSTLLVATAAGLVALSPGDESAPAVLGETSVNAMAIGQAGTRVAVCTGDEAAPMHLLAVEGATLTPLADAIEAPLPCRWLAFVRTGGRALLVAFTPPTVSAWRHDGTRYLPLTVTTEPPWVEVTTALAADLDGDGDDELLTAGVDGEPFVRRWLTTLEEETLRLIADDAFPTPEGESRALLAFDANANGALDLFAAGDAADALFINGGPEGFADEAWQLLPFDRSSGRDAAAGDLNLDGTVELVVATDDAVDRLYEGTAEGFVDRTPSLGLTPPYGTRHVALFDFDADGALDVVTAHAGADTLRVRLLVEP